MKQTCNRLYALHVKMCMHSEATLIYLQQVHICMACDLFLEYSVVYRI